MSAASLRNNPEQRVDAVCAILIAAYETVLRTGEAQTWETGLDVSLLIARNGSTQTTLPLPGGKTIGGNYGIGLPQPCSSPLVESVEQSVDPAGVWVTFSAFDKNEERQSSRVLFLHGKTGGDAIRTEQDLQSEALASLYEQAANSSSPITCNLDVSLLIARNCSTQTTLPLPGGKTIGGVYGIGLPKPCSSPLVESVEQSVDPAGVWVTFSALNKNRERHSSRVLFLHDKTGRDAFRTEQDLQSEALASLYEQAANSSSPITCNLDVSLLIARNGSTQMTLPLPGGKTIGGVYGIGLPTPCSSPLVESVEQSVDPTGVWVTFSALNKNRERQSSRVLFLHDKTGRDAFRTEQDLQSEALASLYEQAATSSGPITCNLDVSLLIARNGTTQTTLPLPGGKTIGGNYGIGLPKPCSSPLVESVEQSVDPAGVWVTFSALNKNRERRSSRVLFLHDKTGRDAIRTEQDLQSEALANLYEQAANSSSPITCNLDVSLLIARNGTTQTTLPLPGGKTIGGQYGIGLQKPCSSPLVESVEQSVDPAGVWVTFSAFDKNEERQSSRVLFLHGKTGGDAIRTEQDLQSEALASLYEQAANSSSPITCNLDVSLLIARNGLTQTTLPLPGGKTIGGGYGIGLPKDLRSQTVTRILHLSDDLYHVTFSAVTAAEKAVSRQVIVSSRGIVKPERSTAATEIAKGHTLDRYVSHLHAATQTNAHRNPLYEGSPLTGERFMPNIVSGQTIVHSKWGNRGEEVLDYIRKYARLRLWNSDLREAAHLIASTSYADELQAALVDLQSKAQVPDTSITDVVTWGERTLGATRQQIVLELERIETMASLGNLEWLRSRQYDPMLASASEGMEHTSLSWEERVRELATNEAIIEVLQKHAAHHSLYWERAYHLELARHCSYLIDCVLPSASLTEKNKDEARRIVYELYPALKSYPDAWRYINDETTARLEDDDDGDGSPPRLTPFNLQQELLRRGLSIPVAPSPLVIEAGAAPDLVPDVNQIFESSDSIKAAITTVIKELHESSEDNTANTYKLMVDQTVRSMVARIRTAICNVKFTESLPERLLDVKNASDPNSEFLDAIKQLHDDDQLRYELGNKIKTTSVSKLQEVLEELQRYARTRELD